LIALLLSTASLWAQEELSEEDAALLQHYIDGSDAVRFYDSFVADQTNSQLQLLEIVSDGVVVQAQESSSVQQITTSVTRGENPNGLRLVTNVDDDGQSIVEASVELRYVDGVVYGNGSYVDGLGPLAFPDGFVEVDPEDTGVFEDFEAEDFVRVILGEPDEDNPLGDFDTLLSLVDSVSSEEGDLDGETVEIITVTIPGNRLFDLLLQIDPEGFGDPLLAALFAAISDDSSALVRLYLDADGLPLARDVAMTVNITDIALSELDPSQPEGPTVNFIITQEQSTILTQINEELPSVSAP
jgi:hypothetical protein